MKVLTDVQRDFYKSNGYIQLSNVFSVEAIDEVSVEYDRIFKVET